MKAGGISFGTEACIQRIEKQKVALVLVAEDAAQRTKKNFQILCDRNKIPICIFGTIEEISKAIGKKNKAIVALENAGLAKEIEKNISGGEVIG